MSDVAPPPGHQAAIPGEGGLAVAAEAATPVVPDPPVATGVREEQLAQLLVVGSRGRGALAGLGLGSVSQSPVAVARTESP